MSYKLKNALQRASNILSIAFCTGLVIAMFPLRLENMPQYHAVPQTFSHRSASTAHITILILDMSGSMLQNDPKGVRCTAAEAFIDLSGQEGDQIGIIALTNGGEPVDQSQQAIIWQEPAPTDVLSQREQLKQVIEQRPPNMPSCQNPFGNTPTLDSLQKALAMLKQATEGNDFSASVILLSDGVPTPDTSEQIAQINTKLIPQFQQHHWPIDTIGNVKK